MTPQLCRTRRPFRGASRPAAASIPSRESKPDFHEHRADVQRIHGGLSIGPSSVWPSPFALGRCRPGAIGSSRSVATRYAFNVEGSPFIILPCSSKHSPPASCARRRDRRTHLSWGSFPFSACNGGRPHSPEIPTSGTFRPWGFSPLRRLASPFVWPGLFHPGLRSWGSPDRRRLAPAL